MALLMTPFFLLECMEKCCGTVGIIPRLEKFRGGIDVNWPEDIRW